MKRRIVLACVMTAACFIGGLRAERTEPAEETTAVRAGAAVDAAREPLPALLFQPALPPPRDAVTPGGPVALFNPARESADWRARAAEYEPLFQSAALRHGVDARWLWIIAYLETRFRPGLVSPKGARGLMQFTGATAARYGLADPHDPATSIDAAARYLRDLSARFGDRLELLLASYNAGEGAVDAYLKGYALRLPDGRVINPQGLKLGGIPPYEETRNYVANGLALARLLSVQNVPVTMINQPAKRRTFGSANGSGMSASRRASSHPKAGTETPPGQETVIRSLRVFKSAATNDAQ